MQRFKSVYFPDMPAEKSKNRHVKIAFGDRDSNLYDVANPISSHEFRDLLGYQTFSELRDAAVREDLPLNTFCLRILRKRSQLLADRNVQPTLPGIGIDSIHSTFRGGKTEPMHRWYPYLEGYSPEFVRTIIEQFAPQAKLILDPFSGSGTTPLTIARMGRRAAYCELNPFLQQLTSAKITALSLSDDARDSVVSFLDDLSLNLKKQTVECTPDKELAAAYRATFGSSEFFDSNTFETVLKIRTLLDKVHCVNPLAASFLSVACLGSLTPSSLLIRAGDLRYRTASEKERRVDFIKATAAQLSLLAREIERLSPVDHTPFLVAEDAKVLEKMEGSLEVEAIITSPPYLNGTNYFRNTKLELWFLRILKTAKHLAAFRYKAITAGINDVSVDKLKPFTHPSLDHTLKELEAKAYDRRIPQMVRQYFLDMHGIFVGITGQLADGAVMALDIGDSVYGGVHVPTDKILTSILSDLGFSLSQEIPLRKRLSRDRSLLRQVLLIFKYKKPAQSRKHPNNLDQPHWSEAWESFRKTMPHQQHPYSKRNWGHPLHSLCSYQGKMKPSLAHYLVNTFVGKNGRILDPFAGVGTIPFEGALSGIKSYGFEISAASWTIASAKVGRPVREECLRVIELLDDSLKSGKVTKEEIAAANLVNFNKALSEYFEPRTFKEVLLARRFFADKPPRTVSECLVMASLLHILHGNRPYALSRRSHGVTPFAPTGEFVYKSLIARLQDKVERGLGLDYPQDFMNGEILLQDATAWWPIEIENLDAIITSPPFFDSTRFYLANWMRLWFAGWEKPDFNIRPTAYIDERQKKDFGVYESILRQARERLKPGGIIAFHLGKSRKCDMAEALIQVAKPWFKVVGQFDESVAHCERHGIRDKGTVTSHQYLILQ